MAMKMITELCGDDAKKWTEVKEISVMAWIEGLAFDAIEETITIMKSKWFNF
jgi:hypothetical protein